MNDDNQYTIENSLMFHKQRHDYLMHKIKKLSLIFPNLIIRRLNDTPINIIINEIESVSYKLYRLLEGISIELSELNTNKD